MASEGSWPVASRLVWSSSNGHLPVANVHGLPPRGGSTWPLRGGVTHPCCAPAPTRPATYEVRTFRICRDKDVAASAPRYTYSLADVQEDFVETQWTADAKLSYKRSADAFVEALRDHVQRNLERSGHETEMGAYMASVVRLSDAASAYNEAEFDWCGSFPLALDSDDDYSQEEDDEERESGDVLSLIGRWDFRVTDEKEVLRAGRKAYRRAWPNESKEDAKRRVQDLESAAAEVMHANGLAGLEQVEGMQLERWSNSFSVKDEAAMDTRDF